MCRRFFATATETSDASLHYITVAAAADAADAAADASAMHEEQTHDVHHMASAAAVAIYMPSPALAHHPYHHHHPKDLHHFDDGDAYHYAKQATLLPVGISVGTGGNQMSTTIFNSGMTAMDAADLLMKHHQH